MGWQDWLGAAPSNIADFVTKGFGETGIPRAYDSLFGDANKEYQAQGDIWKGYNPNPYNPMTDFFNMVQEPVDYAAAYYSANPGPKIPASMAPGWMNPIDMQLPSFESLIGQGKLPQGDTNNFIQTQGGGASRDLAESAGIENPYLLKGIDKVSGTVLSELSDPTNIFGAMSGMEGLAGKASSGIDRALGAAGALTGFQAGEEGLNQAVSNYSQNGWSPEVFGNLLEAGIGTGFGALSGVGALAPGHPDYVSSNEPQFELTPDGRLVGYHGSEANIQNWNPDVGGQMGVHFGDTPSAANDRLRARFPDMFNENAYLPEQVPSANIYKAALDIRNPLRVSDQGVFGASGLIQHLQGMDNVPYEELVDLQKQISQAPDNLAPQAMMRDYLKTKGYDGLVYENNVEAPGIDSYVAFDPNQIEPYFGPTVSNVEAIHDPRILPETSPILGLKKEPTSSIVPPLNEWDTQQYTNNHGNALYGLTNKEVETFAKNYPDAFNNYMDSGWSQKFAKDLDTFKSSKNSILPPEAQATPLEAPETVNNWDFAKPDDYKNWNGQGYDVPTEIEPKFQMDLDSPAGKQIQELFGNIVKEDAPVPKDIQEAQFAQEMGHGEQPHPIFNDKVIGEAFGPSSTVKPLANNAWEVSLPNSKINVQVKPNGLELEFGKTPGSTKKGVYIGKDQLIQLAGETADVSTLNHEIGHHAFAAALNPKERNQLIKKFGNEEKAVSAYAQYVANPKSAPVTIFEKVKAFFKNIREKLFPGTDTTFENIKSGKVWERVANEAQSAKPKFDQASDQELLAMLPAGPARDRVAQRLKDSPIPARRYFEERRASSIDERAARSGDPYRFRNLDQQHQAKDAAMKAEFKESFAVKTPDTPTPIVPPTNPKPQPIPPKDLNKLSRFERAAYSSERNVAKANPEIGAKEKAYRQEHEVTSSKHIGALEEIKRGLDKAAQKRVIENLKGEPNILNTKEMDAVTGIKDELRTVLKNALDNNVKQENFNPKDFGQLTTYVDDLVRKTAEAKYLGKGLREVQLSKLADKETRRYVKNYISQITNRVPEKGPVSKASAKLRHAAALSHLGLTSILQATQGVHTTAVVGFKNSIKSALKGITQSNAASLEALKGGALYPSLSHEVGIAIGNTGYMHGVPTVDRAMRVHSFVAGRMLAQDAAKGNKYAIRIMNELGVKDFNSPEGIALAGKLISDKTQLRADTSALPGWFKTELGKLTTQYMSFAYGSTKFMADMVRHPVKNAGQILRFAAAGAMAGEIAGDLREVIKSLIPGNDEDDDMLRRAIESVQGDKKFEKKDFLGKVQAALRNKKIPLTSPGWRAIQNLAMIGTGTIFASMIDKAASGDLKDITNLIPSAGLVFKPALAAGEGIMKSIGNLEKGKDFNKGEPFRNLGREIIDTTPIYGHKLKDKILPKKKKGINLDFYDPTYDTPIEFSPNF